jgi:4a-hydroxytetrahydrobiopterin dehydratase
MIAKRGVFRQPAKLASVTDLAQRTCLPCRGGVPPLTRRQIAPLLEQLDPKWEIAERPGPDRSVLFLKRTYRFKNFADAMHAAVTVGDLAEEQQHHPDLHVAWGALGVEVWTHKIGGLTESDFIFAAKCDVVLTDAASIG